MNANKLEHDQLTKYNIFKDRGPFAGCMIPCGYQLIRVHTIFDVKVDGQHKTRLVANGHFTTTTAKSVYSGVLSLRGLRAFLFIGVLDGMEFWATDIENAYLEALIVRKFVSELDQSLETSKDTCLSSTKHCMDHNLVEMLLDRCYKNIFQILVSFLPSQNR